NSLDSCQRIKEAGRNFKGSLSHARNHQRDCILVFLCQILVSRGSNTRSTPSIADNGDTQQPLQCLVRLTGKNEGELRIVSSSAGEWKPRKIVRTAGD